MVDHLICRDSYIYRVLRNNFSVHSATVTRSCDTLVLTASSSSSLLEATYPVFFLCWEIVSWTFLGCHYAHFLNRSIGFLELFSSSPLSIFGCLHEVQPPAWLSWESSYLSGLKSDDTLELAWFGAPLATSLEVRPPAWLFQVPSDLSEHDQNSPPWLGVKLPLKVFLGQLKYRFIVHLL